MNKERKLIVAGNWKMNKTVAEAIDLVRSLKIELINVKEVDVVVCPPFTALAEVSRAVLDSNIRLGAQNMSEHNVGAYTGEPASRAQAQEAHAFIRGIVGKMFNETVARRVRIQYGGSVKPANARELMGQADVDGALVGGASLEPRSFADIIKNSI